MFSIQKFASLAFLALFTLSTAGLYAQAEPKATVSDKELQMFASALKEIQLVNEKAQTKMIEAVEGADLSVERFNEIQQQQADPEAKVAAEDMEKFQASAQAISEIQIKAQQKMQEKIVAQGLSIDRYQEIANIVQSDPKLQEKMQQYIQG